MVVGRSSEPKHIIGICVLNIHGKHIANNLN